MSDFLKYLKQLLKNIPVQLHKSPKDGYLYGVIATHAIQKEYDRTIRSRLTGCSKIERIEGWYLYPKDANLKYLTVEFKRRLKDENTTHQGKPTIANNGNQLQGNANKAK